jgi:hypothetical protein
MEHTIGNLGEEIKKPLNPYANLSEWGLQWSQVNMLKAMIPSLEIDEPALHAGGIDLGDDYALLHAREHTPQYHDALVGDLIADYICEAEAELGHEVGSNWRAKVARWAHLRLTTGQTACMAWKENNKTMGDLGRS